LLRSSETEAHTTASELVETFRAAAAAPSASSAASSSPSSLEIDEIDHAHSSADHVHEEATSTPVHEFRKLSEDVKLDIVADFLANHESDVFTITFPNNKKTHWVHVKEPWAKPKNDDNEWEKFYRRVPKTLVTDICIIIGGALFAGWCISLCSHAL
jgi:hypothetical protein